MHDKSTHISSLPFSLVSYLFTSLLPFPLYHSSAVVLKLCVLRFLNAYCEFFYVFEVSLEFSDPQNSTNPLVYHLIDFNLVQMEEFESRIIIKNAI